MIVNRIKSVGKGGIGNCGRFWRGEKGFCSAATTIDVEPISPFTASPKIFIFFTFGRELSPVRNLRSIVNAFCELSSRAAFYHQGSHPRRFLVNISFR